MTWNNSERKKIVLVGGFGFIGQALLKLLIDRPFEVVVIDDLSAPVGSAPDNFPQVKFCKGDIADPGFQPSFDLREAVWVYLAAVPFIPDTFLNPWKTMSTNLLGTLRACRLAAAARAQRFVYISTSEVYGSPVISNEYLLESSPTKPQSWYAISKLGAERVVQEFTELPWVIVRPFNAYGPNATHPYFVPEMIKQGLRSPQIRVGNLNSIRDFTYVTDTADAILRSIETVGIEGMTFNVCSGKAWRMADLLKLIQESCGATAKEIVSDPSRFRPSGTDPEILVGDARRAGAVLNWRPKIAIETGVKLTVEEYLRCGEWPYQSVGCH